MQHEMRNFLLKAHKIKLTLDCEKWHCFIFIFCMTSYSMAELAKKKKTDKGEFKGKGHPIPAM